MRKSSPRTDLVEHLTKGRSCRGSRVDRNDKASRGKIRMLNVLFHSLQVIIIVMDKCYHIDFVRKQPTSFRIQYKTYHTE